MARGFDGSTQYGTAGSAPITGVPLTLACWVNVDPGASANGHAFGIGNSGGSDGFYISANSASLPYASGAGTIASAFGSVAVSTGTASAGSWHHICGVYAAANSRAAYLDGGNKGTNTTSRTPSGINQMRVGARPYESANIFLFGYIAEAAIWNVALSDDDVASLAKRVSPLLIRPEALVGYWPLLGNDSPELDKKGSASFTLTASPAKIDHPRIILPSRPR